MRRAGAAISRIFLRGLVVILPITVTVALVIWLATTAEDFLGGLIQGLWPHWKYWPGLGILLGVLIVFAAGLLVHDPVTRWVLAGADTLLQRIPLVRSIYLSIRDIAGYMSQDKRTG